MHPQRNLAYLSHLSKTTSSTDLVRPLQRVRGRELGLEDTEVFLGKKRGIGIDERCPFPGGTHAQTEGVVYVAVSAMWGE